MRLNDRELLVTLVITILFLCGLFLMVAYVFMVMVNVLAEKFGFPKFDFWESLLVVVGIRALASLIQFNVEVEEK